MRNRRYSLGKNRRLKKSGEIRRVLKKGKRFSGIYMNVFYLPEGNSKISIRLVKGIKGGVERNKLRRRLREIVRKSFPQLKSGYFIIQGKDFGLDAGYNELKNDFNEICGENNLWQK